MARCRRARCRIAARDERGVVSEQRIDLVCGPQVEGPFGLARPGVDCTLRRQAVGVLGRVEPSARRRSSPARRSAACRRRRRRRTGSPVTWCASRYASDELRLVVEHLLEVRHAPVRVHRVAVEPAADVVAHAAGGHGPQRPQRHVAGGRRGRSARTRAAGSSSSAGRGNFGAPPNPPRRLSNAASNSSYGRREGLGAGHVGLTAAARAGEAADARRQPGRRLHHVVAVLLPCAADLLEHRREARPAVPARPAGSTCRRRRAGDRASATRSSASRPTRSWPARTACRPGPRPGAPRDRP